MNPTAIRLAVSLLDDDLDALEAYFDDRADADYDEGYLPNEEMRLLNAVTRIREQMCRFKAQADKEMGK